MTGLAQVVFPAQANGSLIERNGRVVGSALIGQSFDDPRYFWGRPSATSPFPYNAAASSGSNLGPSNPALTDAVQARIAALQAADPGNTAPVPADLVTASGSGSRPAHQRRRSAVSGASPSARPRPRCCRRRPARRGDTRRLRSSDLLGEPRVNVLKLNLALDGVE